MAKISMAKAAKMFDVSRPTLSEHLKSGKISGEKVGESWQLDTSELLRVYGYRGATTPTPDRDLPANLSANLSAAAPPPAWELESKIKVLEAQLEASIQARELLQRNLDDFRHQITGPQDPAPRRRWWHF